jgi:MFS family permease
MAMPVAMMIVAPVSGWLSDKVGPRIPASLGWSCLPLGFSWLAAWRGRRRRMRSFTFDACGRGLYFQPRQQQRDHGRGADNSAGIANGVVSTVRQPHDTGVAATTAIFKARYPLYSALGEARATMAAVEDAFLVVASIILLGALTSLVRGTE